MKIENINLPHHITVDAVVMQKLNYLLDSKYSLEFTGFCHSEKREDGEYHISDIFFPRQDNTSTTTECDSEDIIALMQEGLDISKTCGHAHSHVNMGVFASGTDKKDIIERAKDSGYNAAIIVNKKGHIFGHIADMDLGIYVEDCPVYITYPFTTKAYEEDLLKEIKKCDNLDDIKEIANYSMEDYMEEMFPLSTVDKEFLDLVMKNRFQFKTNNFGKKSQKKTTTSSTKPATFIASDKLENVFDDIVPFEDVHSNYAEEHGYPDDPKDFFSKSEWAIIERLPYISAAAMTDEEWRLQTEMDTLYPNYIHF